MFRTAPTTRTGGQAIRYAVTSVIAAGLLAGCAGSKHMARAGDHAVSASAQHQQAVEAAEAIVAHTPDDAAARRALGQVYLEAGRFRSAATTFADAVSLGDGSGRTQLSLALAHIGAGDTHGAVAQLDEAGDAIPASDRGLALALAGETSRGVATLINALREGDNSPKLRQNLAFAYALDGRWREARMAMAQDVPPDRIDDRIGEWAMMSRAEDVQRRVASLLSVPAGVADAGQPTRLALRAGAQAGQLAVDDTPAPESIAPVSRAASAELPPIEEAPPVFAAPAAIAAPAIASAPAPAPHNFATAFSAPEPAAASQPTVQTIAAPPAYRAVRAERRSAVTLPTPAGRATHAVQLGSFSSEANARRAIGIFTARDPELRGRELTITPAVVRGKNFWRVAATGFDGGDARRVCSGVKNRGGACFAYAATNAPAGGKLAPAFALARSKAR
jgi:Flp pilus assembly protein TadD